MSINQNKHNYTRSLSHQKQIDKHKINQLITHFDSTKKDQFQKAFSLLATKQEKKYYLNYATKKRNEKKKLKEIEKIKSLHALLHKVKNKFLNLLKNKHKEQADMDQYYFMKIRPTKEQGFGLLLKNMNSAIEINNDDQDQKMPFQNRIQFEKLQKYNKQYRQSKFNQDQRQQSLKMPSTNKLDKSKLKKKIMTLMGQNRMSVNQYRRASLSRLVVQHNFNAESLQNNMNLFKDIKEYQQLQQETALPEQNQEVKRIKKEIKQKNILLSLKHDLTEDEDNKSKSKPQSRKQSLNLIYSKHSIYVKNGISHQKYIQPLKSLKNHFSQGDILNDNGKLIQQLFTYQLDSSLGSYVEAQMNKAYDKAIYLKNDLEKLKKIEYEQQYDSIEGKMRQINNCKNDCLRLFYKKVGYQNQF